MEGKRWRENIEGKGLRENISRRVERDSMAGDIGGKNCS